MFKRFRIILLSICLVFVLTVGNRSASPSFAQSNGNDNGALEGELLEQKVFIPLVTNGQSINSEEVADDTEVAATVDQESVIFNLSKQQADRAEAFWTRSARLAAKAASVPELNADALVDANAAALGQPGFSASGKPAADADKQALRDFAEEWNIIHSENKLDADELVQAAELAEVTGTSGVYTTYIGNLYNELWQGAPYRATGKLYSSVGSCSASVISSRNILVTAAHCVYNTATNQLYSNIAFVPAERNNARPYGTFSASAVGVLNGWINLPSNQVSRFDIAVVRLNNNSVGRPVTFYTGWLGRSWNFSNVQNITEIGYPSNRPSGSLYTYIGHAETYNGGTELLNFGSNMGFGASGSPLLRLYAPYKTGSVNSVNGVQSGSSPNGTNPVFNIAPQFTSNNIVVLCNLIVC